jgi:hypothetical protein
MNAKAADETKTSDGDGEEGGEILCLYAEGHEEEKARDRQK